MKIDIEYTEQEMRKLLHADIEEKLNMPIDENDIKIELKSKQNYKSEWESAAFRARVGKFT